MYRIISGKESIYIDVKEEINLTDLKKMKLFVTDMLGIGPLVIKNRV